MAIGRSDIVTPGEFTLSWSKLPGVSRSRGPAADAQAQVAGESDRLPMLTLLVLGAAIFAGITTEVLPVGLLPDMASSLHTSVGAVGLLVSGYAVVVAIGSVPMALATARWSRRRTLCLVLVGYALSNLVIALTSSYGVMLSARMLGGLAHAALFPTVIALAVESAPPTRAAHAVAVANGGAVVALTLGVPIGTSLGTSLGWRWAFAVAALTLLVLAVAALLLIRDGPGTVLHAPPPRGLLARPALLTLAAGIVVFTLGHYAAYTYVTPLMLHAGVAAHAVGPVLFGYGLAGLLGLTVAARLGGPHPRPVLAATVTTSVLALLALAAANTSAAATIIAVVVWGASFAVLPSLLQTAALRLTPGDAGIAPALVNSMWNIGICGGAAIGGHLLGVSPTAAPLFAAALMTTSLALLLPSTARPRPGRTDANRA
jgi:DHA1 family inner membrane transport protein